MVMMLTGIMISFRKDRPTASFIDTKHSEAINWSSIYKILCIHFNERFDTQEQINKHYYIAL